MLRHKPAMGVYPAFKHVSFRCEIMSIAYPCLRNTGFTHIPTSKISLSGRTRIRYPHPQKHSILFVHKYHPDTEHHFTKSM